MPEGDTFLIHSGEPSIPAPKTEPQIFDQPAVKEYQESLAKKEEPRKEEPRKEELKEKPPSMFQRAKERLTTGIKQRLKTKGRLPTAYVPASYKERDIEAERKTEATRTKVKEQATRLKEKAQVVQEKARETGAKAGEYIKGTKLYAGLQVGAQETRTKAEEGLYRVGKGIGRLPVTIGEKGYGLAKSRYQIMKESIKASPQRGWHSGLLWEPGAGQPRRRGGMIARVRAGGGYYPGRRMAGGRQPRFAIPRGYIRPYWSKKLKKLARQNLRKYGAEEGMARTRQIATLAGWKMQ